MSNLQEGQDEVKEVLPDRRHLAGGSVSLIAQDVALNVDQLGGHTLKELAISYGISDSRMRQVLHAARRPLRRKGMTICVPVRAEGFVYVFTAELVTYLFHYGHRHDPITSELEKVDLDIRTLNNGVSMLDGVITAMDDFAEMANTLILNGNTP